MSDSDSDYEHKTLKQIFADAEKNAAKLSQAGFAAASEYQSALAATIAKYDRASAMASAASLFSANEAADDIATSDLPFLAIDFRRASLREKLSSGPKTGVDAVTARRDIIRAAEMSYRSFLQRLADYELLDKDDDKLWEKYQSAPEKFTTTAGTTDAAAKRALKIERHQREVRIKNELAAIRSNPRLGEDEEIVRKHLFLRLQSLVMEAFQALEMIQTEKHMFSFAISDEGTRFHASQDNRERGREGGGTLGGLGDDRTTRTEILTQVRPGASAVTDRSGKLLRPVTILGSDRDRNKMTQNVFRSGHNLPTMTVDEYLEEERRRGNIIEGGGPESGKAPEVDEDDLDEADKATMKARYWDEFKEENPRGAGNTMNRG